MNLENMYISVVTITIFCYKGFPWLTLAYASGTCQIQHLAGKNNEGY
jgi:hypothetical protein